MTLKKSELDDLILEKAVARFKEANKEQDKATKWYELLFALALNESAQQEKKSITWKPPYNLCTITTTTSDEGKITQGKPIINNDKYTYSSPYTSYTISTSGEETIQAKPAGDGPFTAGCCCENTNKDSLNYKQTTAPYSSLS